MGAELRQVASMRELFKKPGSNVIRVGACLSGATHGRIDPVLQDLQARKPVRVIDLPWNNLDETKKMIHEGQISLLIHDCCFNESYAESTGRSRLQDLFTIRGYYKNPFNVSCLALVNNELDGFNLLESTDEYSIVPNEKVIASMATPLVLYKAMQRAMTNQELEKEASFDPLTGTLRKAPFLRYLGFELARASRYKHPFCLLMGDLDNFKRINDKYGHNKGDNILANIGQILGNPGIIRDTDITGRYGGEEMCILFPETDLQGALVVAERVRNNVKESEEIRSLLYGTSLTISLGLFEYSQEKSSLVAQYIKSRYPQEEQVTPRHIIDIADIGLYKAKQMGKNNVQVVTDQMISEATQKVI